MKTLNLLPESVEILLPKGKPDTLTLTFPYAITGYTYVSKIIDSADDVVATLTCTPNTGTNTVVITISEANALLIETGHRWYLEETRSVSVKKVVGYGPIKVTQVTDL